MNLPLGTFPLWASPFPTLELLSPVFSVSLPSHPPGSSLSLSLPSLSPELLPGVRGIFELLCHLLSCLASCYFNSRATDPDANLVPPTSLCSRSTLNGGRPFWRAGCSGGASLQALSSSIRVLPSARTEYLWGQQHGPVPSLSLLSLRLHCCHICSLQDSLHRLMGPNFWTTALILSSVQAPLCDAKLFLPT